MAVLKNRAGVVTATAGTASPIQLGAAIGQTSPFAATWQTFAASGVVDGDIVRYLILDSNGAWEYGLGMYLHTTGSLNRAAGAMDGTVAGQKSSTGARLVLTGNAQVFITAVVEDLDFQPRDNELTALAGTTAAADQLPYFTSAIAAATTPLTAFARTLLDDTSQAAMQTTLGVAPATGGSYVAKAGDTMSGDLTISKTQPMLLLDRGPGAGAFIVGRNGGSTRWQVAIGNATAEGGGNAGSDFTISRSDDVGSTIDIPLSIQRSSGIVTFSASPLSVTPPVGDNTTKLATTAFVKAQAYAPLASPVFTGDPQAPTPPAADNDTSIATTAFVQAAIAAAVAAVPSFTTGDAKLTLKTVADPTWILMNDGTIGSATSGATTRANADTQPLYTLIWNTVSNTFAPVTGGRGASAAADFTANKPIALTRQLGRAICIANAGGGAGLTARTLGGFLGAETHTQTLAEIFSHGHTYTDPTHAHSATNASYFMVGNGGSFVFAGGADIAMMVTNNIGGMTASGTGISIQGAGSSSPMDIMNPSSYWNIMIKL